MSKSQLQVSQDRIKTKYRLTLRDVKIKEPAKKDKDGTGNIHQ